MDLGIHYANEGPHKYSTDTCVCVCVSMHVSSSFHQLCSVLPDIENLHLKLCMCINEYLQAHTHTHSRGVCVCVQALPVVVYFSVWV